MERAGEGDGDLGDEKDFDNYKINESDVVDNSSVDIWRVISSRYMRSALPVLLEKKK